MIKLEPAERAYMTEMRMLTIDPDGREHLFGLTEEESDFYASFARSQLDDRAIRSAGDGARYLELNDKHERARFAILGAEYELRSGRPTRN